MRAPPIFPTPAIAVLAALVLTACSDVAPQAQAQPPAPRPVVTVVETTARPVPLVSELPGRTAAHLVAELRPQVNGIIEKQLFREGSEVKAGQALYQIDAASYAATLKSAQAGLARAEAALGSAQLKARRYADLVEIEGVSRQANDEAQASLQQARADVATAQAAVEQARIDLDFTRVRSPISGRIGRSAVTAGALVTANQAAALATVRQLDPIYVDLTQSVSELTALKRRAARGELRQGDATVPLALQLEDGSDYPHPGRLAFSEVSVDEGTGTVTLRAEFPNPDGDLLPGMYVRARLTQGESANAILLPHAAVGRDARGRAIAMVVGADGVVEARPVTADRSLGDQWVITAGLAAGERVVVEGLQKIRAGVAVEAESKPAAGTRGEG